MKLLIYLKELTIHSPKIQGKVLFLSFYLGFWRWGRVERRLSLRIIWSLVAVMWTEEARHGVQGPILPCICSWSQTRLCSLWIFMPCPWSQAMTPQILISSDSSWFCSQSQSKRYCHPLTLGQHKTQEEGFTAMHFLCSPEQPEDTFIRLLI